MLCLLQQHRDFERLAAKYLNNNNTAKLLEGTDLGLFLVLILFRISQSADKGNRRKAAVGAEDPLRPFEHALAPGSPEQQSAAYHQVRASQGRRLAQGRPQSGA